MPGLTLDKFDIGIYIQYARRTELIESVRQQLHMPEASQVAAQTLIVDIYPKLTEVELLLGIAGLEAPWAYFYPPRRYRVQHRSPFAFHRIMPIFVSEQQEEKEEEKLDNIECETEDEENERIVLKKCFSHIKKINELVRFIGGRIGQFLQG
jgi:hypothetical protein